MRDHLPFPLAAAALCAALVAVGCGNPEDESQPGDAAVEVDSGSPASDAGEESDAGQIADASLADAGRDAGSPPDAGKPDAGAADAGTIDAGPCANWPESRYAEPECGPANLSVQFNGSQAITDTGLDVYDVLWDFGDGNTSWATNPTHNYWGPGDFDVVLKLTADYDGMDVTVTMPPVKIRAWDP
jgi:hypothetical protein